MGNSLSGHSVDTVAHRHESGLPEGCEEDVVEASQDGLLEEMGGQIRM